VTFVGSAAAGKAVAHACAERLAPVQLELGGKSPSIVFPDADLPRATPVLVKALVQNAGQSCSAGTRLIVHRARHAELLELVAGEMRALRIGPGCEDPDLGPLISAPQIERAEGMLRGAVEGGAEVVLGGGRPAGREEEWFLEPTIVTGAGPGTALFEEEVFGPVLNVTVFDDEDEAVTLANATPYGLVSSIWTADVARAHRVAAGVQAGQIYINGYGVAGGVELPFGGMKRSGYGRGKGMEAMHSYTQIKNVCVAL
jgi:aldehyde dehydrogenase (NAD+)/betaine-aldehyde dehydrogenase